MEIGIISDTHSFLDPNVFKVFENCDEIWHAGDFGAFEVAEQLRDFKTLRGVYGNIDAQEIRQDYPENLEFECGGVSVLMTHIAGRPGRYPARVKKLIRETSPQIFICGHSHILHVENDDTFGVKYINPGAAGHEGAHIMRTVLKCQCIDGELKNLRLIELGQRGRTKSN